MCRFTQIFPERLPWLAAVFYNKVPAKALMSFYKEVAAELTKVRDKGKILDIGTGPGLLPIEIAKRSDQLEIVGIDLSSEMIQIARKNAKREKKENIKFEVCDANHMPYPDNFFDFVVSTATLHHWHDRAKVFSEIYRALKSQGLAWIYDLRSDATREEIAWTIGEASFPKRYLSWAFRFHGLKTEEYLEDLALILKKMNLEDLEIEKKGAFMRISWKKG